MMKKLLEKKQWMMLTLVAAWGVAVYLNYYFTKEPSLSTGVTGTPGDTTSQSDSVPLGEASYVNAGVSGTGENGASAGESGAADYFDNARASRTAAREEAVRLIGETLGSAQSTAEQKAAAEKQTAAIAESILQESNIENLIVAKGFADCVTFIDGEHCQVVVDAADLQPEESLQILEIVMAQSPVEAKNVQITTPPGKKTD